ncbi:UDP-galactopyranose mutase [Filimonas lacunae]|uniref:UDP-galactopyranose mutase n=1 Tax=Filimonas lacunae TaxID=477680 RepID=A0A173MJB9_9BACT|nr:NAD(P)/FAD-dependent oxidoreductase [Filimonas lacunae]BAV07733.1 protoporphyrinogen oxidase [Filimonas lacunae]SIT04201.1 UDP-galactopyranose mutase [Filimonas lacunae]
MKKTAIIIGAGPAGLTAAYELLTRTDIVPVILEKSGDIGGISKTVNYKGNRIDIGGHRFFSKSDRVMNWWLQFMPVQDDTGALEISYQNKTRQLNSRGEIKQGQEDKVMLVRNRLSRIYFLRKFFSYPIKLSVDTLRKLGLVTTFQIMYSYLHARLRPLKEEKSLEDFFINRFGKKLYHLFFKDYTEKVWGVPCKNISAEWGAQRIKGVSISAALAHAVKSALYKEGKKKGDIHQKDVETSLIEKFLYPKFGPGQLWEEVARQIQEMGGTILMHENVQGIEGHKGKIASITTQNAYTNECTSWEGDYYFSTMPVQELIAGLDDVVPSAVQQIAAGLQYRDFITVGVLLKKLSSKLEDTWIYIQEKDVKVGRLQLFNNWSPFMVNDPDTVWVGMEYFCNTTDDFWKQPDEAIKQTGIAELKKMGLALPEDVLDATVLRMEKTYPAYFGTYERFDELRRFTDQYTNLFLVGRNGMHKYNNADHSMLTAMVAVDNIVAGYSNKDNIWSINTEQEYHEEKKEEVARVTVVNATPAPNLVK